MALGAKAIPAAASSSTRSFSGKLLIATLWASLGYVFGLQMADQVVTREHKFLRSVAKVQNTQHKRLDEISREVNRLRLENARMKQNMSNIGFASLINEATTVPPSSTNNNNSEPSLDRA